MDTIIIKVGTSTLTQGRQGFSRRSMLGLAQQIVELESKGKKVILVSSGAVAAGRDVLSASHIEQSESSKQTLASIGQIKLMQTWSELFSVFDRQIGQVLFSKIDFSDGKRRRNTCDMFTCLWRHHVIPIVNENDAIVSEDSRIGDNDNLAALVALLVDADALILLTDQEGLFSADPRIDSDAKLIPVLSHIDEKIMALAQGSGTSLGTGGMITKIEAARAATEAGIRTFIASSAHPNVLLELAEGKQIGTVFLEKGSKKIGHDFVHQTNAESQV
jgi:glutamate 5-kinase